SQRVEEDEWIVPDQVEKRVDEGVVIRSPRSVPARELAQDFLPLRTARVGAERFHDRVDLLGDPQRTDRAAIGPIRALENEPLGPVGAGPGGARDFLEVVIVGQRPEDRNRRDAATRELARERKRAEPL